MKERTNERTPCGGPRVHLGAVGNACRHAGPRGVVRAIRGILSPPRAPWTCCSQSVHFYNRIWQHAVNLVTLNNSVSLSQPPLPSRMLWAADHISRARDLHVGQSNHKWGPLCDLIFDSAFGPVAPASSGYKRHVAPAHRPSALHPSRGTARASHCFANSCAPSISNAPCRLCGSYDVDRMSSSSHVYKAQARIQLLPPQYLSSRKRISRQRTILP